MILALVLWVESESNNFTILFSSFSLDSIISLGQFLAYVVKTKHTTIKIQLTKIKYETFIPICKIFGNMTCSIRKKF